MQLYYVSVWSEETENYPLDRVDLFKSGKAKEAQTSNAKECVPNVHHVSRPIRYSTQLRILHAVP
jgi:hypothetical protein